MFIIQKGFKCMCHSISLVARNVCSAFVDPVGLSPLLACHLIALNKNPGVRPIGIAETVRRIIAKAVLSITRLDILNASGPLQLCAGQIAGVEAAIHAVRSCFEEDTSEGIILVDASNAFNSLNHHSALLNIRHLCPSIATVIINCYREPGPLTCLLVALFSSLRRVLHKGTHSQCLFMPWPLSPLSLNFLLNPLQDKYVPRMTPLP